MKPRAFFDFAARVSLAANADAAAYRSAVSRAYYSAYHVASDMLEGFGFRCRRGENGHLFVQQHLQNSGDSLGQEIVYFAGRLAQYQKRSGLRFKQTYG